MKYGSVNYHNTKRRKDFLTATGAAKLLGVSVSWLRMNIAPTEWHHSNLKYGGSARANFWHVSHMEELKDFAGSGDKDDLFFTPEKPSGVSRSDRKWNLEELRERLMSEINRVRIESSTK